MVVPVSKCETNLRKKTHNRWKKWKLGAKIKNYYSLSLVVFLFLSFHFVMYFCLFCAFSSCNKFLCVFLFAFFFSFVYFNRQTSFFFCLNNLDDFKVFFFYSADIIGAAGICNLPSNFYRNPLLNCLNTFPLENSFFFGTLFFFALSDFQHFTQFNVINFCFLFYFQSNHQFNVSAKKKPTAIAIEFSS